VAHGWAARQNPATTPNNERPRRIPSPINDLWQNWVRLFLFHLFHLYAFILPPSPQIGFVCSTDPQRTPSPAHQTAIHLSKNTSPLAAGQEDQKSPANRKQPSNLYRRRSRKSAKKRRESGRFLLIFQPSAGPRLGPARLQLIWCLRPRRELSFRQSCRVGSQSDRVEPRRDCHPALHRHSELRFDMSYHQPNYEAPLAYEIGLGLQRIALAPDDVTLHKQLRTTALRYKAAGGRAAGVLERMKLPSSDALQRLLHAERGCQL